MLLPHPAAPNLLKLLIGICRNFPKAFVVLQTPGDYASIRRARAQYDMPIEHTQARYFYDASRRGGVSCGRSTSSSEPASMAP